MAKKTTGWKTKGMNRDLSVSAYNPEFAFENVNLRLSTNEGNTTMSWVNEKGTAPINVSQSLLGIPVGTAVINHQLVVFTTTNTTETHAAEKTDRIYKMLFSNSSKTEFSVTLLFAGNLNLSTLYPLETLVSYETDSIQKVYWTDNRNQPRLINIANTEKLTAWNSAATTDEATFFDFVPAVNTTNTEITVTRNSSAGTFAPGVIQYLFTYYNKNGQQSCVFYTSPLYYLAHNDRGAGPEDSVSTSFKIAVQNADTNFDYLRVYSLQRTSLNATPIAKQLLDVKASNTVVTSGIIYSDNEQLTLPYDSDGNQRLLRRYYNNATVRTDVQTNLLLEIDGVYGLFDNDTQADFVCFVPAQTPITYEPLNYTMQQLLYDLKSRYNTGNEHFVELPIDNENVGVNQLLLSKISEKYSDGVNRYWALRVQGHVYGQSSDVTPFYFSGTTIMSYSFVYNLTDKRWYINTVSNVESMVQVSEGIEVVDNGTIGSSIDPTELLFMGGKEIVAKTMSEKDSTLFIGNFREEDTLEPLIQQYYRNNIPDITFSNSKELAQKSLKYAYYKHTNTLSKSRGEITTFKGGEWYRFGFQLQKETGEWTEPVFLKDEQNTLYPSVDSEHKRIAHLVTASCTLNLNVFTESGTGPYYIEDFLKKYKRARPVVVYPDIAHRRVICQGVVNPTVFNVEDRANNSPFVQSSWCFRPYDTLQKNTETGSIECSKGKSVEYRHYKPIKSMTGTTENIVNGGASDKWATEDEVRQVEIQGAWDTYDDVVKANIYSVTVPSTNSAGFESLEVKSNKQFFVDQSIVTLNSPDLEFDTQVQSMDTEDWKFRVVGYIPITGYASHHTITATSTSSTMNAGRMNTGTGEDAATQIVTDNRSAYAVRRLVALDLWGDNALNNSADPKTLVAMPDDEKYYVYPWQRSAPLNNDIDADGDYSKIITKKMSHLLVSGESHYLEYNDMLSYESISVAVHLQENAEVRNYRLKPQIDGYEAPNYYPNIDKVLYSNIPYRLIPHINQTSYSASWGDRDGYINGHRTAFAQYVTNPISMKYLSGTHAVMALGKENSTNYNIPIMPYAKINNVDYGNTDYTGNSRKYWQKSSENFANSQNCITLSLNAGDTLYSFLWLGEFYRDVTNPFGDSSDASLKFNDWVVGGDAVDLTEENIGNITLLWTEGDTYYQRYDCLKTYPFTKDDVNQNTEILSFMCETHVNIDGRYDKNRGLLDNTNVSPENFNLMNDVYSQKDNFFTYKISGETQDTTHSYPNQCTYTLTKEMGADVDLWTHVTLGSTLALDGNKGTITKLTRLYDNLYAFQNEGIAQILYNENTQISTTAGVPIEIANSGKVQGCRYISNTIGCDNMWAITKGNAGIYFADGLTKSMYLFNGQLQNLSQQQGMNSWCRQNITDRLKAFYDKQNNEALFIGDTEALAYSEKVGSFTSFYDYYAPYFCNLDDTGIWLTQGNTNVLPWKHQAGDYCKFFGVTKPYSTTLIGNPEPLTDKVFTNLEFRATVEGDGTYNSETGVFTPLLPFDSLEVWDEYQHGFTTLTHKAGSSAMQHHTSDGSSALQRKFRIWRCDIPRDNADVDAGTESPRGIWRVSKKPLDRMRNPWVYLKLVKNASDSMSKIELHDLIITYFN
mgnify:FL=1